jgi:hypothetical protein
MRRSLESVGDKALNGYSDPQSLFCDEVGQSGDENVITATSPTQTLEDGSTFLSLFGKTDIAWANETMHITEGQQTMFSAIEPFQFDFQGISFSSQDIACPSSLDSRRIEEEDLV